MVSLRADLIAIDVILTLFARLWAQVAALCSHFVYVFCGALAELGMSVCLVASFCMHFYGVLVELRLRWCLVDLVISQPVHQLPSQPVDQLTRRPVNQSSIGFYTREGIYR